MGGQGEEVARSPSPTVFVSDPSAEAERISQALRTSGYVVVDVPMSMLLARVAVQRPRVVLVDADAEGALESVGRLRELPDAEGIDIVFLGKAGEALKGAEDAMAHEGSGFFDRPVDIGALVRKVEALTGGAMREPAQSRHSTPPPSLPASRMPQSAPPGPERRASSRPPPASPGAIAGSTIGPPTTTPETMLGGARTSSRRTVSIQTPLSSELEALLAEAEKRLGDQMGQETALPTPEEEIEAVLPAEILSSLDDPVEEEEDDAIRGGEEPERAETGAFRAATHAGEAAGQETSGGAIHAPTTGNRAAETSARGERGLSTSSMGAPVSPTGPVSRREGSAPPPPTEYQGAPHMPAYASHAASSTLGSVALQPDAVALDAIVAPRHAASDARQGSHTSQKAESVPPPVAAQPAAPAPSVLGAADAPVALARAIAARATGALCVESEDGIRRAVLREGDLVTAASGVDAESLLAFLGGRGDLSREKVQQLGGKVPPFGRHAGAALVANGHLRQDQLWPVLRAHAEWILGKAILVDHGTAHIEAEPPGRLKNEPSVFGGSTGAEVLIELVRRVIAPEDAVSRLGGSGGRLGEGNNASLLSECALEASERDLVTRMRGSTIGEVAQAARSPDFASVVYALSLLGVVDVARGVGSARGASPAEDLEIEALDEEAIRERVRARLEIVDDGDYFAVLGVPHDATGYEVRRAFLELRRSFEPSRVLTPRIADLADDVRKISIVLEEAYEILSDNARRERYRRAIFAAPGD